MLLDSEGCECIAVSFLTLPWLAIFRTLSPIARCWVNWRTYLKNCLMVVWTCLVFFNFVAGNYFCQHFLMLSSQKINSDCFLLYMDLLLSRAVWILCLTAYFSLCLFLVLLYYPVARYYCQLKILCSFLVLKILDWAYLCSVLLWHWFS